MPKDNNLGPYVRHAAFCGQIKRDQVGHISGLDGLTSNLFLRMRPSSDLGTSTVSLSSMPNFRTELKVLVVLVAGDARGRGATLKFEMEDPTGIQQPVGELPIEFIDSSDATATVEIAYELEITCPGLYWLDIYIAPDLAARTRLLSRIPLSVHYQQGQPVSS
jgi:hypothetical protein